MDGQWHGSLGEENWRSYRRYSTGVSAVPLSSSSSSSCLFFFRNYHVHAHVNVDSDYR